MVTAPIHQQASLLHQLSNTTMGLEYTSSFRGMEDYYSFFFKEYSTPADPSPGYSCQVHDEHGCHPMVNTQEDGTKSPFVHQPPSLTGWHLSPPRDEATLCRWGAPFHPSSRALHLGINDKLAVAGGIQPPRPY